MPIVPFIQLLLLTTINYCDNWILGNQKMLPSILKKSFQSRQVGNTIKRRIISSNGILIDKVSLKNYMINTRLFSSTSTANKEEITNEDLSIYTKLKEISTKIRTYDELYYSKSSPLTDEEYDKLVQEEDALYKQMKPTLLLRLQHESGHGVGTTRHGRIGYNVTNILKKRHHLNGNPLLSLDNGYNDDDITKWLLRSYKELSKHNISDVTILSEPKLDGLSLSLRYKLVKDKYELEWAATRGNGYIGEDVTHAIHNCTSIPKSIIFSHNRPNMIEVRGEIVIPPIEFKHYLTQRQIKMNLNESNKTIESLPLFSNARNAITGVLRRYKMDHISSEFLSLRSSLCFYAYDIVCDDIDNGDEMRELLTSLGFIAPEPYDVTTLSFSTSNNTTNIQNINKILAYYNNLLKDRYTNPMLKYEMDGIVLKHNTVSHRNILGITNKAPKWAIAYKFPYNIKKTKLKSIKHSIGRTGVITPVAIVESVDMNGVIISKASLHNYCHLDYLFCDYNEDVVDCRQYDVMITIARAGDVIPQVIDCMVVKREQDGNDDESNGIIDLKSPKNCPSCNAPTIFQHTHAATSTTSQNNTNTTHGKILKCSNKEYYKCKSRAIGLLSHAYSKNGLDIVGLSQGKLLSLFDADIDLKFPCDLFLLLDSKGKLLHISLPNYIFSPFHIMVTK